MEPLHYTIQLTPDLHRFLFDGVVIIDITIDQPEKELNLDIKDLAIWECALRDKEEWTPCKFTIDNKEERLSIVLPKEVSGQFSIKIVFLGKLQDDLLGFYRSRYVKGEQEFFNAVTQFEERHARKAFPCFDQPAMKAIFDIAFVIDTDLQGIANTPIKKEEILEKGKKKVEFEPTPKMSTYLLFFGVGKYHFLEDRSQAPLVRFVGMEEELPYGHFGLEWGRKSLNWCEEFTGIPFPISKCDYISISDFAYGAMENWAAITFRENLLLYYPNRTPKAAMVQAACVIAHETAHMWFGDLVSPKDWKYIWLNESFASYFTVIITNMYHPEWHQWDMFTLESTLGALERDALHHTVPIELPKEIVLNIDTSVAPIIYNKGAAIIRMLVDYLGVDKFRKAVTHFLTKFQFASAGTQDYWDAFTEATGEPVSSFADSWVHQPGYPFIKCSLNKNSLKITQQRFTFLPGEFKTKWFIPITFRLYFDDDHQETQKVILTKESMQISLPKGVKAVKLNQNQESFYRVNYSPALLDQLGTMVKTKKLHYMDCYGLVNDVFAFVKRGDYSIDEYLTFLEKYYIQEESELFHLNTIDNLQQLALLAKSKQPYIFTIGRKLFESKLQHIGLEPREEESLQITTLRDRLLWVLYEFGSPIAIEFGQKKFRDLQAGHKVHPDILASILRIGAASFDDAIPFLIQYIQSGNTTEVEKQRALYALGCTQNRRLLEESFILNLEKIPKRNRVMLFIAATHNGMAKEWLWLWVSKHLDVLRREIPGMHIGQLLVQLAMWCSKGYQTEITEIYKALVMKDPTLQGTVDMSLEIMDINSRLTM